MSMSVMLDLLVSCAIEDYGMRHYKTLQHGVFSMLFADVICEFRGLKMLDQKMHDKFEIPNMWVVTCKTGKCRTVAVMLVMLHTACCILCGRLFYAIIQT